MTELGAVLESAGVHVQRLDQTKRPDQRGNADQAVSSANPAKGKPMNSHAHSMSDAPAATGRVWFDDLEHLYGEISILVHQLHFLTTNLEWDFDVRRARRLDGDSMMLTFQKSGVDATLWLVGDAWSRAVSLRDKVVELEKAVPAEGGAA